MTERESAGFLVSHAFLVLDGSGSMTEKERASGKPKFQAVAEMVQRLINELHDDPQFEDTSLTVMCYDDLNFKDIRLHEYNVQSPTHYNGTDLNLWNPINGHGHGTPIGDALGYARECAEGWVERAEGLERRRAVIYLLSDGMRTPDVDKSDPMEQKALIEKYNARESSKGNIRVATIGYFQGEGSEPQGRALLADVATNRGAYFESDNAAGITNYILNTIAAP